MATEWDGLLEHPAWVRIADLLKDERADALVRLIQTAAVSQDAAVAVLAREIQRIDKILAMPLEERERELERDAAVAGA